MDDATKDAIPGDWAYDRGIHGHDARIADENDVTVAYVAMEAGLDRAAFDATAALMAESKRLARAAQEVAAAFACGNLTEPQKDAVEACVACLESLREAGKGGG